MEGVSGVTGAGPLLHRAVMAMARRIRPNVLVTPTEAGAVSVPVCRLSGMRVTPECAQLTEWFVPGTEPTRADDWERGGLVTLPDEYADWSRQGLRPVGDEVGRAFAAAGARVNASDRSVSAPRDYGDPAVGAATRAAPFRIISPLDGDRYSIPVGVESTYASVALRASGKGAERVRWTIDGRPHRSPAMDLDARDTRDWRDLGPRGYGAGESRSGPMSGANPFEPKLRGISVPVDADPVDAPIVTYGDGPASINFPTRDQRWGRVTFEKLDSIRVSRGEYDPYPRWERDDLRCWVSLVMPSPWLRERYEYEKRHYGRAYEFGGDVGEMLRDFSHYVFSFHDQFVEALCAGIWFETADTCIGNREPDRDHPLLDLPVPPDPAVFEAHGITCHIRRNTRPLDHIVKDAELCSQTLLQFAADLDGSPAVSWTLTVRVRDGQVRSYLKNFFGNVEANYDGIATLEDVRPRVHAWLREVKERRGHMGKA